MSNDISGYRDTGTFKPFNADVLFKHDHGKSLTFSVPAEIVNYARSLPRFNSSGNAEKQSAQHNAKCEPVLIVAGAPVSFDKTGAKHHRTITLPEWSGNSMLMTKVYFNGHKGDEAKAGAKCLAFVEKVVNQDGEMFYLFRLSKTSTPFCYERAFGVMKVWTEMVKNTAARH